MATAGNQWPEHASPDTATMCSWTPPGTSPLYGQTRTAFMTGPHCARAQAGVPALFMPRVPGRAGWQPSDRWLRSGGIPMLKMMGGAPGGRGDRHDHRARGHRP
jgi:hypothetical protein